MAQYYMLNKPRGLLTARRDARCETVMRCFPEALQQTLHPVGRLDKDTEGLLLFTDDGMLDVRLLRPERHVEKEYEYRAFGHLDEAATALPASADLIPSNIGANSVSSSSSAPMAGQPSATASSAATVSAVTSADARTLHSAPACRMPSATAFAMVSVFPVPLQ